MVVAQAGRRRGYYDSRGHWHALNKSRANTPFTDEWNKRTIRARNEAARKRKAAAKRKAPTKRRSTRRSTRR